MKSILRWSAGLLGLLLFACVSDGYYWVTPVFRQPYPVAPSPSNSGFYLVDAYGRCTGPHYYLVPPFQPFNGMLPGKTGQSIMQGNLPHALLMSKEGLALGQVPRLGDKAEQPAQGGANPQPGAGMPRPMPYGGMPNSAQSPFKPIPGFNPMMPGMAPPPGTNMGQINGFPPFAPMQPFNQFNPLQAPRMDMMPPPQQRGIPYPTHPFTRSPRDFFMWGENMEEERARGSRPFPVP